MRSSRLVVLVALAATGAVATGAIAAKKAREAIWTRPDYASLHVDRIALIPPASYDNNFETETLVETALGAAFKGTGYRWISSAATRDLLRDASGNDSLLKVVKGGILAHVRVDSLAAPGLAAMLRCDALLSVRVDQMEEWSPDWNQSGKPYRTVQLHASLVDSLGRLLWTASGGQMGEGPYYDPASSPTQVKDMGSGNKPSSRGGGAPTYREVVTTLLVRWAAVFPPKPSAAGASEAVTASPGAAGAGTSGAAPGDSASRPR